MLPSAVMQQAQDELLDWQGQGCSVMELSHRNPVYIALAEQAEQDLRRLLAVPDNYQVLFLQGGGRGQFAAVPLNLQGKDNGPSAGKQTPAIADYICAGYWAQSAADEARKYLNVNQTGELVQTDAGLAVSSPDTWQLSSNPRYVHYCSNETIEGIRLAGLPKFDAPLVADMSSDILSGPINVADYGVIYASAQKNIGPSGLAIAIVRNDLLDQAPETVPSFIHYHTQAQKQSMYNTPPTYAWYLAGLVFKWLLQQGGLSAIAEHNQAKANVLYQCIDDNDFYRNGIADANRSLMNVPFQLADAKLDAVFLQEAEAHGLKALKGHRAVGGMRASIYNAMPLAGVQALVSFMQDFARRYG